jgi:hypothetical protein
MSDCPKDEKKFQCKIGETRNKLDVNKPLVVMKSVEALQHRAGARKKLTERF